MVQALLITNGKVIDGAGAKPKAASLLIENGAIAAIGARESESP